MNSNVDFMPAAKLFTTQANVFYYSLNSRRYREDQGLNLLEDRKKAYSGKLSSSARRVIKERLTAWLYVIQSYNKLSAKVRGNHFKRLVMCTLTLSSKQMHTDKFIKDNMLELFFKRMQYNYGASEYFWKAETQRNGNIHFHIWFDVYIDKYEVQRHWNEIQDRFGYIEPFFKKYKYRNPPSTDIEVIDNKRQAIEYVMKYVSKENEGRKLEGRVFSFSSKLLKICLPAVPIDDNVNKYLSHVHTLKGFNLIEDSYYSVLRWKNDYSPINSGLAGAGFYKDFFMQLAKLFYLTDADDLVVDAFVKLYCNFYSFSLNDDRHDFLLLVSPYISMRYSTGC